MIVSELVLYSLLFVTGIYVLGADCLGVLIAFRMALVAEKTSK